MLLVVLLAGLLLSLAAGGDSGRALDPRSAAARRRPRAGHPAARPGSAASTASRPRPRWPPRPTAGTPSWSSTPTCWPTRRSRSCERRAPISSWSRSTEPGRYLPGVTRRRHRPRRPGTRLQPARGAAGRPRRRGRPGLRHQRDAGGGRGRLLLARRPRVPGRGRRRLGRDHAARLRERADQRPPRRRGQRRRWPSPCSARARTSSGTSRRWPTCRRAAGARSTPWCRRASGGRSCSSPSRCCCWRCGAPAGWAPWSREPLPGRRARRRDGRGPRPALPAHRIAGDGRRGAAGRGPQPPRRRDRPAPARGPARGGRHGGRAGRSTGHGRGQRDATSCTVPNRPTTPHWCASPTTSTAWRGRYAARDRAARSPARQRQPRTDPARAALLALRAEVAKAVVGQDAAVTGLVDRPAVPRPRAARGRARRRQDAAGAHAGGRARPWTPSACSSPPT